MNNKLARIQVSQYPESTKFLGRLSGIAQIVSSTAFVCHLVSSTPSEVAVRCRIYVPGWHTLYGAADAINAVPGYSPRQP